LNPESSCNRSVSRETNVEKGLGKITDAAKKFLWRMIAQGRGGGVGDERTRGVSETEGEKVKRKKIKEGIFRVKPRRDCKAARGGGSCGVEAKKKSS